jgi:hypothetical protein
VAVILRECGFDERTIADALGQKTIEMARHYARGADLTKKMDGVAKKFGREVNRRRTKVSNLAGKASNLTSAREDQVKELKQSHQIDGGRTRIRTLDPLIKSQLLYQLSYAP